MHQDGSSCEWSNHPGKKQTALQLHHLGGYSKRAVKKLLTIVLHMKCSYFINQQFISVSATPYTLQNEVFLSGKKEEEKKHISLYESAAKLI